MNILEYDLILLDFDGLLVNTEDLHFEAYRQMLKNRGYDLKWDFRQFSAIAHVSAIGLRDMIYQGYPELYSEESDWSVLYKEKQRAYLELLRQGELKLLPGVAPFLKQLAECGMRHAVVTNSTLAHITLVRDRLEELGTIPGWITREDYEQSKPAPDGYLEGVKRFGLAGDRSLGIEDTLKGVKAINSAGFDAMLICSLDHPQMKEYSPEMATHFCSMDEVTISSNR